jgi:hypothetical protein
MTTVTHRERERLQRHHSMMPVAVTTMIQALTPSVAVPTMMTQAERPVHRANRRPARPAMVAQANRHLISCLHLTGITQAQIQIAASGVRTIRLAVTPTGATHQQAAVAVAVTTMTFRHGA